MLKLLQLCVIIFMFTLLCFFPFKALLSGCDQRFSQHRSQPAGGAAGGRTSGEPFRAVCPTGPGRKKSEREGLRQGAGAEGTLLKHPNTTGNS